jgi:hypothetical protein
MKNIKYDYMLLYSLNIHHHIREKPITAYGCDVTVWILRHWIIITHYRNLIVCDYLFGLSCSVIFLAVVSQAEWFSKKKSVWPKMCVLILFINFIWKFSQPRRNSVGSYHEYTQVSCRVSVISVRFEPNSKFLIDFSKTMQYITSQ